MPVKDRVVTWFIQNVVIPKREIIDNPGFIVTTFTEYKQETYLREIFLGEFLFELIEDKIIERYGDQGKQVLYSAGKKFGYLYASLSNFPTINNHSIKELNDFLYSFVRYLEVTFSRQATHEINFEEKSFTIALKDYIVCRHNGHGYIMTEGGTAGIWAFMMQDNEIESSHLECQGRGDSNCLILCAPKDKILEKTKDCYHESNLFELKFGEKYKVLNEIRKTTYARYSMRDLIDTGLIDFKDGSFSYKNMRLFGTESHILYILEREIAKLDGGEEVLFEACFSFGKFLCEIYDGNDYNKFIPDFFSALGFGDIFVNNINGIQINFSFYPWTTFSDDSTYVILRGVLSGFISNAIGENIYFSKSSIDVGSYLTLTVKT